MNFDLARHKMVAEQLERRGISDPRVLEAMDWVPRHEFVPAELIDQAYEDRALPIGLEQTISQPYTVAYMCQEAHIQAHDKVLEIGTGSGYGAAVLSLLAREVHSIERIAELHRAARERTHLPVGLP
jgi:protein-L-isoaspartate(D-aspartate) O-methyltransferase